MSFNPQFAKLGDILVHENIISQDTLMQALDTQKITKKKLGDILINNGDINEHDLVKAFSLQTGHKPLSEDELFKADVDTAKLIPEDFAVEKNILALRMTDSMVTVAMEDPEDISSLDTIKKLTNKSPDIYVAAKSALEKAISSTYNKIKQSGEVETALSQISIVRGDEEDSDELDLATEEVSAEDAPYVKLVNVILAESIKEDSTDIHIEPGIETLTLIVVFVISSLGLVQNAV